MNLPKTQIDKILAKWLTNTASQEDLQVLKDWASQDEANLNSMEALKKVWSESTAEPILVNVDEKVNEIWQRGILDKPKKTLATNHIIRYAAVILLLMSFTSVIFYFSQQEKMRLENLPAEIPSYVIRENKAGQKTKIFLPDGSVAFLNSSSSIKYLSGFIGDERRVVLEGEAFFEVAKDETKPFIVESRTIETIALGTAFNINAFDDSDVIRVSLVDGEVRVNQIGNNAETVILNPGYEVIVEPNSQSFLEMPFKTDDVLGWKEGKLVFKQATFYEVSQKLERWYGVQIKIRGNVPINWKVTTVYHDQSLKNVLTDLKYSKKFAYEINESTVTITF